MCVCQCVFPRCRFLPLYDSFLGVSWAIDLFQVFLALINCTFFDAQNFLSYKKRPAYNDRSVDLVAKGEMNCLSTDWSNVPGGGGLLLVNETKAHWYIRRCDCVLVLIWLFSLFYFFGFCRKSHRVRLKNDLYHSETAWRMISPRVCSNGAMVVVVWRMVRSYATQPFFSAELLSLSLSIYELLACWLDSPRRGDHTPLFCTHLGPVFVDLIKARSRDEYRRSHSRDAHCNYVHTWIGKSAPSPALEPYPCRGARRGMYTLSLLDSTRHHHHLHHSHRRHTPLSIYVKRCTIPIIPGRLFLGVITVRSKTASDAATCESVTGWHRPGGANYLIDLSHIFVALFWLNPNQPTHTPPNSAVLTILCIFSPFSMSTISNAKRDECREYQNLINHFPPLLLPAR